MPRKELLLDALGDFIEPLFRAISAILVRFEFGLQLPDAFFRGAEPFREFFGLLLCEPPIVFIDLADAVQDFADAAADLVDRICALRMRARAAGRRIVFEARAFSLVVHEFPTNLRGLGCGFLDRGFWIADPRQGNRCDKRELA
jgi:hypothetical protein